MISSHKIPPIAILYIFIGATQQVRHLGKGGGVDKESKKMTKKGGGRAVKNVISQESNKK